MKRFSKLVSAALAIVLLAVCALPVIGYADSRIISESSDYRYVLTTTLYSSSSGVSSDWKYIGTISNTSNSAQTIKKTVNVKNTWQLQISSNAARSDIKGLPGNWGKTYSTHTYTVQLRAHQNIRLRVREHVFTGKWKHVKQRQHWNQAESKWQNTGSPSVTYSNATGRWVEYWSYD